MKEDIEFIRPTIVNLDSGKVTIFQPTRQDIDRVLSIIRKDYEQVDLYNNETVYPPIPEPSKCRACAYLNSCDTGRRILNQW